MCGKARPCQEHHTQSKLAVPLPPEVEGGTGLACDNSESVRPARGLSEYGCVIEVAVVDFDTDQFSFREEGISHLSSPASDRRHQCEGEDQASQPGAGGTGEAPLPHHARSIQPMGMGIEIIEFSTGGPFPSPRGTDRRLQDDCAATSTSVNCA